MSFASTYLPLITAGAGYAAALLGDARRDARAAKRTAVEREAASDMKREERREAFELETLQRAHTALSDLSRSMMRHHLADKQLARDTSGPYGVHPVDDALGQAHLEANRSVHALAGLILDDRIRDLVRAAHESMNRPSGVRGPAEQAERLVEEAASAVVAAQDAIAARIREIYKGAVTTP